MDSSTSSSITDRLPSWLFSATFWILLAGILRLLYLAEQAAEAPWFNIPIADEAEVADKAKSLLAGQGFGPEPFFRSPLYTLYVTAVMKLCGSSWIFVVRFIQHLCGALLVGVGHKTAFHLFPSGSHRKWAAALTAALLCFNAPLIRLEHRLVLDFWVVFLQSSMLMFLLGTGRRQHLWSGICAGLAWLTRPTLLVALPFIAIWIALRSKSKTAVYHFLLPIGLAIGGFTLCNGLRSGEWLMLPWQGGFNFYHANKTGTHGRYFSTTQFSMNRMGNPTWELMTDPVKAELGDRFRYSEVSPYWMGKAKQDILDDPARWIGLMGKKAVYLLNAREIYNFEDFAVHRKRSSLLRVMPFSMGWLVPLGLAALPLLWVTARKDDLILLLGYGAFIGAGIALYYTSGRLRMPLAFPFAVFAGSGISLLAMAKTHVKQAQIAVMIGVIGLALSWSDWWGVRSEDLRTQEYAKLSLASWRGQDFESARNLAEEALTLDPTCRTCPQLHGQALFALGEIQPAIAAFEESVKRLPQDPQAPFNLGYIQWIHFQQPEAALPWVQQALKKRPDFERAKWLEVRLLIALGKTYTPLPDPGRSQALPFERLLTLAAQSSESGDTNQQAFWLNEITSLFATPGRNAAKEEFTWMGLSK